MANVWVIAEVKEGKLKKVSTELLTKGRDLASKAGGQLEGVLLGSGVEALAADMAKFGAAKVHVADSDALKDYVGEAFANAIAKLAEAEKPGIILIGASVYGKDLAPRLAAKLGAGLASDCTDMDVDGGKLTVVRPVYAGKALASVTFKTDIQVASVRPNLFAAAEGAGAGAVAKFDADCGDVKVSVKGQQMSGGDKIELTEAAVIVAGGRGCKDPKEGNAWQLLEDLAKTLNAAVGASRAAVDAGWRGHGEQVGQTGKVVNPTLYIAAGISGAIQHLAGMSSSKCIVAVNKDPEAPIFGVADYGIVGDLNQVLPLMNDEFKKMLA
jgi:electron transfer flavoprotein alpha subunit